jgi:class 3 adenylate cyclase
MVDDDRNESVLISRIVTRLPVFSGVDPRLLAEITPKLRVRVYAKDDPLFRQGEIPEDLIIVLNGRVSVSAQERNASGQEIPVATRGPDELVGEQAFIENIPRTATATALETVRVLLVERTQVFQLLEDPNFLRNTLRVLSKKLSEATDARAFHYRNEGLLFGGFRAHVSPEVAQELLLLGRDYGRPRREMAVVLFSDIREFTSKSAPMEPLRIAGEITRYFDHVVEIVHRHHGMVDKFMGDAVMALWGAFLPANADPAALAIECAAEMVATAGQFTFGNTEIKIGVGMEVGEVFVGNIGGEGKLQFTVLGPAVNLASRYETKTKRLQVPIIVGSDLHLQLPPKWQDRLLPHTTEIKGLGPRTVYVLDPLGKTGGNVGGEI